MTSVHGAIVVERLGDIQLALREERLEGWLLYDHRGQSPLARRALGLTEAWPSRRWLYWLPADGMPALVVHAMEADLFGELPGDVLPFHDWTTLRARLERLLPQRGTVVMEHQSIGGSPDLSRIDAGTLALVQSYGPRVASCAELSNRFFGPWRPRDAELHARTSAALEASFAELRAMMADAKAPLETDLRSYLAKEMSSRGLVASSIVTASGVNTQQRAARISRERDRPVRDRDLVVIEASARDAEPLSPYAHRVEVLALKEARSEHVRAFGVAAKARDAAAALLGERIEKGRRVLGFEIDLEARRVIEGARIGARVLHRTGHHLGWVPLSGEACTFDALEIHDVREAVSGLAWSIHPGVYFDDYGLSTATSVRRKAGSLELLASGQAEITVIG